MASRIKKYLKKLPVGQWKEGLHKLMAADSTVSASIEVGLFRLVKMPVLINWPSSAESCRKMINSLMSFDGKETEERSRGLYRCVRSVKKRLSKGAGKRLLASLMQHFNVEIEQDVLKTVNCCGSN